MVLGAVLTSQLVFDGVVNGLVIGLIALGVVLVHRASRVINFAVGNMGVIGAAVLALLVVQYHLSIWLALPIVLLIGTAFGVAVELSVVRRLFEAPRVILLVATIGVAGVASAVVAALPEVSSPFGQRYPVAVGHTWDDVAGVRITGAQLTILVVVPLVAGSLAWILGRTLLGKAVLASADNPRLARTNGINPKWVSTFTWGLAGLLSTVSMVLASGQSGSLTGIIDLGPNVMVRALAAFLVAGRRSFGRALAAGVVIGVAEAIIRFNFLAAAGLAEALLFVAVLVAVWFQSRQDSDEPGHFSFATTARPVPARLQAVWWARHLNTLVLAVMGAAAIALPLLVTAPSRQQLYTIIIAFAICGVSLVVLTGWAGQPSLGQMAFAGIGALTAAALVRGMSFEITRQGRTFAFSLAAVPFVPAVLIAALVTAALAAVIGIGALRVRGMLLGVSTFAFAIAAGQYLYRRPFLSDGQSASVALPRGSIGPVDLGPIRTYYYVVLATLAVVIALLARLRRSGVGRTILAVRDNPDSAAAYTVAPGRTTLRTFALAGGIAGLGGALLAGAIESVPFGERFFQVQDSLSLVGMVVIGGLGALTGPVLGALWVIGLPAFFPDNDVLPLFASSMGLLLLLLYFPGGLVELGHRARHAFFDWAEARYLRADAAAGVEAGVTVKPAVVFRRADAGARRATAPESAAAAELLVASDISVRFGGIHAVQEVSLSLAPGEVLGLIGANGAGKSTLMNAIGGFVPTSGSITLLGRDVSGRRAEQRARLGLGRTFQAARLFPELSVRETIQVALESARRSSFLGTAFGLRRSNRAERAKRSEADELITFLGLGRYADRPVVELSTGTRRILELACLLALRARVLCLDEPTAGVAQRETEALGPLVLRVREELDAGLIVIEHDMPFIAAISDRLVCLEAGRVIASGSPDEIRHDPLVVASYLGTAERSITRSDTSRAPAGVPD